MMDSSTPTFAASTSPLGQLRLARERPLSALLGATAGLVPVGVFELGHYELTAWSPLDCPKAAIVYAGLLFSALTVLGWSRAMFGSKLKSLGFTALLEGIMMTADAGWLTGIALGYLVVINAVANGCRLALHDAATQPTDEPTLDWVSNLACGIAAAAAACAATRPARRPRRPRARRRSARPAPPRLEVVPG